VLSTLLFFHLLAVGGLFTGKGLELTSLMGIGRASTLAELRAAGRNLPMVGPLMGISVLVLLATGSWLMYVSGFGWSQGWINLVLALTIVLAMLGFAVTGRRTDALHAMAERAGEGAITPEIETARQDRVLRFLPWFGLFEIIAALYIMTAKPNLTLAIIVAIAGAGLGVIPGLIFKSSGTTPAPVTPTAS
jgi:uncharacterized membrane protein